MDIPSNGDYNSWDSYKHIYNNMKKYFYLYFAAEKNASINKRRIWYNQQMYHYLQVHLHAFSHIYLHSISKIITSAFPSFCTFVLIPLMNK